MQRIIRWLWVVVALGMAGAAELIVQKPDPLTGLPRYLFAPGVIGYLFVGGTHGGASSTLLRDAYVLANGLIWGCIAWCCTRFVQGSALQRNDSAK
jgi:hypothetical protein